MLTAIGLMVGAYIILRCVIVLSRTGERSEHDAAKWVALFVMLFAVYCMYEVWTASQKMTADLSTLPKSFPP